MPGRRRQPPVLQDRLGGTHLTVTQPVTWTHAAARTATRHVCRPPAPRARSRAPVASSSSRVKKRKKRGKIEEKKGKKKSAASQRLSPNERDATRTGALSATTRLRRRRRLRGLGGEPEAAGWGWEEEEGVRRWGGSRGCSCCWRRRWCW